MCVYIYIYIDMLNLSQAEDSLHGAATSRYLAQPPGRLDPDPQDPRYADITDLLRKLDSLARLLHVVRHSPQSQSSCQTLAVISGAPQRCTRGGCTPCNFKHLVSPPVPSHVFSVCLRVSLRPEPPFLHLTRSHPQAATSSARSSEHAFPSL